MSNFVINFVGSATGDRAGESGRLETEPDFETDLLNLKISHRKMDPRWVLAVGVRLNRKEAKALGEHLLHWAARGRPVSETLDFL